MSETLVVALTFIITYAIIIGHALYLHRRHRRAQS